MSEDKSFDELLAAAQERAQASGGEGGQQFLNALFAAQRASFDPTERVAPPSRRRPRREEPVTYRVRVELADTAPPVWRRLELASDLFLNEVHDVIQASFAWQDSHLHRFGSGPGFYSPETEYYLMQFDVAEGETGVPEEQVRLDEVLVEDGDRLFYVYDFGDDWEHVLTLQAVLPREQGAPRAVCTAGRRPAPSEDCGGVMGYELLLAATDPQHPEHVEALAEYREMYGQAPEPERAPVPFGIEAVNAALLAVTGQISEELPEPIADLVAGARLPAVRGRLAELCSRAVSDQAEPADAMVREAVRAYVWLLDHVGEDGLKLTGAGYLPPASVQEAAQILGLDKTWIGKANREVQTLPVLWFRESAQGAGLLRKYKGKLLLTPAGRRVRGDHRALWDHLAEHVPPKTKERSEWVGGLLLLLAVAAAEENVFDEAAELMTGLGWRLDGNMPISMGAVMQATESVRAVLNALGGLAEGGAFSRDRPTERGTQFARAALLMWP